MSTRKATQPQTVAAFPAPKPAAHSAFESHGSSGDLLIGLFRYAAPNLGAHDLVAISKQAAALAEMIARDGGAVAEGVLITVNDSTAKDKAFQSDHHLPALLSSFSEAFRQVAGLTFVAGEAASLAQEQGAKL